jgi:replicative DNA helicase
MTDTDINPLIDLELERTVLGGMLAHQGTYADYVEAGLTRECFYRGVHGHVWEAIQAVDGRGERIDLPTVWQELKRKQIDDAVGQWYFGKLGDGCPAPGAANAAALTLRLTELAAMRTLRIAAQVLEKDVLDNPDALSEGVVAKHLAAIEGVLMTGAERLAHKGAAEQLHALAADIARDKLGKVWLGWPNLDEAVDGCRPGEVCGLMARPGIGKTLALGHVARVTAESEIPHVFFSLEMPTAQIVERLARALYRLGRHEMRDAIEDGRIDRDRYTRVFRDLVIVDTPGLTVAEMAARLRTIQSGVFQGRPIRLVTIDHLGLIGGDRKMATYDRVSVQAREIKDLAKRINATVLLAIQVNRDAGGDGSKELGLGAARDSGVVEEAMDYLIALRRLDQSTTLSPMDRERYRDCLFAKVVKNRHGMNGREIGIRIDPRTLMLTEDPMLQAESNDLARIAAGSGRR